MVLKKIITMKSSLPQVWARFKFDHTAIEARVDHKPGAYQGLSKEALYTSQEDFYRIFSHPLVKGSFVDLGCGTGESCLLYGTLFPDRKALGIEFQNERLVEGKKFVQDLELKNVTLLEGDLLHDRLPEGDHYFLYFPTGPVLDRILSELYERKAFFHLIVIESHGDLIPRLRKENWLKEEATIPLSSPRHHPEAIIFGPTFEIRNAELLPHLVSYQEKFLIIQDQDEWIGESMGLEWVQEDLYNLSTPPRTIDWKTVKEVLSFDEVPVRFQKAITLRRLGELTITTPDAVFHGFIRKITLNPTFRLEISSGEQVEWNKIVTIHQGSRLCYESFWPF